jgi:hypothetical protein
MRASYRTISQAKREAMISADVIAPDGDGGEARQENNEV